MRDCAEVMLRECARHLAGETTLERIGFVLYDDEGLAEFERVLTSMKRESAAAGAK